MLYIYIYIYIYKFEVHQVSVTNNVMRCS